TAPPFPSRPPRQTRPGQPRGPRRTAGGGRSELSQVPIGSGTNGIRWRVVGPQWYHAIAPTAIPACEAGSLFRRSQPIVPMKLAFPIFANYAEIAPSGLLTMIGGGIDFIKSEKFPAVMPSLFLVLKVM